MRARIAAGKWTALATGWLLAGVAGFLAGCLKDYPLIRGDEVYDANLAVAAAPLDHVDSLRILLVRKGGDSADGLLLWSGPADSIPRLPLRTGPGDEFLIIIQGFSDSGNYCLNLVADGASRSLLLNDCGKKKPRLRPSDTALDFGRDETEKTLTVGVQDTGAWVTAQVSPTGWLTVDPDSFAVDTAASQNLTLKVDRLYLEPGLHQALVNLYGANVLLGKVRVKAMADTFRVFSRGDLDFGESRSSLSLRVDFPHTPFKDWLGPTPDWAAVSVANMFQGKPGDSTVMRVDVKRDKLSPGENFFWLFAYGNALRKLDSIYVTARPKRDTVFKVQVRDWGNGRPIAGVSLEFNRGLASAVTDSAGFAHFTNLPSGAYGWVAAKPARIGGADSLRVDYAGLSGDTLDGGVLEMPPAVNFTPLPTQFMPGGIGHAALVDGRVAVPGQRNAFGNQLLTFPLNNLDQALQTVQDMGDEPPDGPYEAWSMAGNSASLYIGYTDADRLGRVSGWKGPGSTAIDVAAGFSPYGLLLAGEDLLAIGRTRNGALVLGRFGADLAPKRLDTLGDLRWDGISPQQRGPKLVAWSGAYYAVDGNRAGEQGHLIRIDTATLEVDSLTLADQIVNDLCPFGPRLYVTAKGSAQGQVRVFNPGLQQIDTIPLGRDTDRITFAGQGKLAGYGFVSVKDTVFVIHAKASRPLGSLALPGGVNPVRSLVVDGETGKLVATDGGQVFIADFAPQGGR